MARLRSSSFIASPSEGSSHLSPSVAGAPASALPRKAHTKSRTGCFTCKRRKVKCDETHPSCRNCLRRSIQCDFLTRKPTSSRHGEIPGGVAGGVLSLNLLDLELLHNFTSTTYTTLTNDPELRAVWRGPVMRRAVSCEFVMRAVLSVSAVHIAQHRPEEWQRYMSCAAAHHQLASRTAIELMTEEDPDRQDDLWIFSVLTIYYALGSARDQSETLMIGENLLPDWVFLLSGVYHLLQDSNNMTAFSGITSLMVTNGQEHWQAAHQPTHENADILHELRARVNETVLDEGELAIYNEAIRELRCQLSLVMSAERRDLDIMDAFMWHFIVAKSFMPLLKEARQEAVAIFAHSLIIFHLSSGHKWLRGWDVLVMSRIWEILDEEHRVWISWPIEEIGWVPPSVIRDHQWTVCDRSNEKDTGSQ